MYYGNENKQRLAGEQGTQQRRMPYEAQRQGAQQRWMPYEAQRQGTQQRRMPYEAQRQGTQQRWMPYEAQRQGTQQRQGAQKAGRLQRRRKQHMRIQAVLVSVIGIFAAVFICMAAARIVMPRLQQNEKKLQLDAGNDLTGILQQDAAEAMVGLEGRTSVPRAAEEGYEASAPQAAEDGYEASASQRAEGGAAGADLTNLYSPYAVLIDADTGEVLAEQNSRTQIYPASLTKIMTALLVIENSGNLDETVWIPSDIYDQLYAEGASMAGFLPGEETTLRELLYGILLPSGAECCLTAARYIAGSDEAFVELMNQKAAQLGMENTSFQNCTGLQDAAHYSSAADIAGLLRYALQDSTFREIFTSQYYYVQPTEQHPDGFTFWSTLFSENDGSMDGVILGGKTGYTQEAGLCLASLLSVGGREYILVTAGAAGSHETEPYHIKDALNVAGQLS